MRRQSLSAAVANKIYDVLVEHVPVKEFPCEYHENEMDHQRFNFVRYATDGTWTEFRFGGPLGFGGKVWNNMDRWYVTCYREDETPKRLAAIERTNAALDKLWEETYGEPPSKW